MTTITLFPLQEDITAGDNQSALDVLQQKGYGISSPCGKNGKCGKCRIRVVSGKPPHPTPEEVQHLSQQELAGNVRLACQLIPTEDLTIELIDSNTKPQSILRGRKLTNIKGSSSLSKKLISAHKNPSQNETAIYRHDRIIGTEPGDTCGMLYGLAVDIGTSTVVVSLFDLSTKKEIGYATAVNPQNIYGQDVLSRITYAGKPMGLKTLQTAIIDCINGLIDTICQENTIDCKMIYDIVVAANTTMLHLLVGIDPGTMGRAPYLPVFTESKNLQASDFALQASPFARLQLLPGVSGFIGADIVAGVTLCNLHRSEKRSLFIDIGTNGEIVFSNRGKLIACACAAGPALEGMNISCGMLAGNGAIENVRFTDADIELQVIGSTAPRGLCGSGLIDAVSGALRVGLLAKTGRIKKRSDCEEDPVLNGLVRFISEQEGKRSLILDETANIFLTQADIRQVQLAKGAILSGILALMNGLKIPVQEIDEVLISGQFGSHLLADSLIGIHLLPPETLQKIRYIGNSSHTGAAMALLSEDSRVEMETVAAKIEYIELSLLPGYEELFTRSMGF